MEAIKTSALTKYYGRTRGVKNLDLSVMQGDFFGFIGPNGAGKSTTIRILLGLVRPSSGSAALFGEKAEGDMKGILRRVGYLPSEASFYHGMKVRDILKYSAKLRGSDCRAEAERLCERLELDPTRPADELSLGNRKKVGIVCALQHKPELLILDEPTSGLDPLMQREFYAILHERSADGATVFLSSHVLSEIQRNCNRAAIIREGELVACDVVEALSKTSARRVTVHGNFSPQGLEGVTDLSRNGDSTGFLYRGKMQTLISAIAEATVSDLEISEPDLEEIFLHYYQNGGENI